jgi:HAD superfamily hydrolase (TIGR01549 family)
MDGTLIELQLDFPKIKQEMGIGTQPILEAMEAMNAADREIAAEVLQRHEDLAAQESQLNPGCRDLLEFLQGRKIPIGLITRNSRHCTRIVLEKHGLNIPVVITRDDCPYKPSPIPLQTACERLAVKSSDVWMIGDGQYDIEAGNAAEIFTVWISHGRNRAFAANPRKTVANLIELRDWLTSLR